VTKKWIQYDKSGLEVYDDDSPIMGLKIREKSGSDGYLVSHYWFSIPTKIRVKYFTDLYDVKNGAFKNLDLNGNVVKSTFYYNNKEVTEGEYKACLVKKRFSPKIDKIKNKELSLHKIIKQIICKAKYYSTYLI
jgi:hypothetical protein